VVSVAEAMVKADQQDVVGRVDGGKSAGFVLTNPFRSITKTSVPSGVLSPRGERLCLAELPETALSIKDNSQWPSNALAFWPCCRFQRSDFDASACKIS
jgi:hypothetical protein